MKRKKGQIRSMHESERQVYRENEERDREEEILGREESIKKYFGATVNNGINRGIDSIIKMHPRFGRYKNLILSDNYFDHEALNNFLDVSMENIIESTSDKKKLEQAFKELYNETADYVASGKFFNERGKEFILRKSLEEEANKGIFRGAKARRILSGEKRLETIFSAFKKLKDLAEAGGYEKNIKEVYKSLEKMEKMGFGEAGLNILKGDDLISKKEYMDSMNKAIKSGEQELYHVKKSLENYINPEQVAAAALCIGGFGLCLTSISGITGNVVGMSGGKDIARIILGIIIVVIGIILWKKKCCCKKPEKNISKKIVKKKKRS